MPTWAAKITNKKMWAMYSVQARRTTSAPADIQPWLRKVPP